MDSNSDEIEEVKIFVTDRQDQTHEINIPLDIELNLMEVCKASGLPVDGTCGGIALCASCHIYVESDHELEELSEDEEIMLDQILFVEDNSRLACQIRVSKEIEGLELKLANLGSED